jgi:iron complex transport system permease protein
MAGGQTDKHPAVRVRLTPRRLAVTLAALALLLLIVAILSTAVGSEHVGIGSIIKIIAYEVTGGAIDVAAEQRIIIADVRIPRVLMAIVVGAALSVAGAAFQALLRNPLADPAILGVSSGAAVGAILATIFAESLQVGRPFAAFVGALITIAVVYVLGQSREGGSTERLILAGVIVNALLSSLVIFLVTTAAGSRQRGVLSWLIGDLSGETHLLPLAALFIMAGVATVYINARSLNLMMTGDEDASALGVEVRRVKFATYLAASLITGAAVSISGAIGFVGLIVPHAVRLAWGSDNRLVLPASALVGSCFVLLADTVARTLIAPREVHIGVITSLVGAPVFVYLLRRSS